MICLYDHFNSCLSVAIILYPSNCSLFLVVDEVEVTYSGFDELPSQLMVDEKGTIVVGGLLRKTALTDLPLLSPNHSVTFRFGTVNMVVALTDTTQTQQSYLHRQFITH